VSNLRGKKKQKILVIDDEIDICKLAVEMLNKQNYDAVGENFFSDGLEYFKKHFDDISLILMDYTIPGESAMNTVESFRAINPNVPIIIMSGYIVDDNIGQEIRSLNIDSVIQKPFDMFYLIKKVQNVI
jgi:DNA-binding NtrC family response regulator